MANKSENAEIAVLQDQMGGVKDDLKEVKGDVKTILGRLDVVALMQGEINALKTQILDLKSHRFQTNWLYPTLAAAAGAVIAVLITKAIKG